MTSFKKRDVLEFTGQFVGSAAKAVPEGPQCLVLDYNVDRPLRDKRKPASRHAIPPPSLPKDPGSLAKLLTAGVRACLPNVGILLEYLIGIRVADKRLTPEEAVKIAGELKVRLLNQQGIDLHDCSEAFIMNLLTELKEHGDINMLYSLEAERHADSRLIDYGLWLDNADRRLCPHGMELQEFKNGTVWSHYALLLLMAYRCVEEQIRAKYAVRKSAPPF
jgi:hypothetical protein